MADQRSIKGYFGAPENAEKQQKRKANPSAEGTVVNEKKKKLKIQQFEFESFRNLGRTPSRG